MYIYGLRKGTKIMYFQLSGILMGMEDVQWNSKVPLITMETEGSNCFNEALKAGKIVTLNGINRSVHVL